ncbi:MAG: Glucose/mannose symporter GlcP [Chlamydiales bacterium]|jgi:sugar porter (SP) family MFS transporter|nr:Glucose/mannose symporter GlcP [Chlamydiales bacterium]
MDFSAEQKFPEYSLFRLCLITITAALGGFLFGFDTAIINGTVEALEARFAIGNAALGLSISSALLGSAAGAFFAGSIADRYGRRWAMLFASVLFALSAIGSGVADNLWAFNFWRILGGWGVGVASVIAPAYIAETAPAHLRGRLGSFQQLAIVSGIFTALLVAYLIATSAGSAANPYWFGLDAWRWMLLSELPPAILYGIGAYCIPESPRFLVAKGKIEQARGVLETLIGATHAEKVTADIQRSLKKAHQSRFLDLKGKWGVLPIVWLGIALSCFQQFVGINVIFYYSSSLWQSVGFSEADSLLITVITSVTNIITTLLAIAMIDKIGRRPLLLFGSVGLTATLTLLAYLFGSVEFDLQGNPILEGNSGVAALIAANLYVFFFGLSWGPVVWVLLGEMFPNRIRAYALSLSAAIQWLANFAVSVTFPSLQALGLGWAYGLYAAAALLSLLFVYWLIPETKGKELEAMNLLGSEG